MPSTRGEDPFRVMEEIEDLGNLPEGHYALRADEYDGFTDPVEKAQRDAARAAIKLNTTPRERRTADALARVSELSALAAAMATEANLRLITGSPEA